MNDRPTYAYSLNRKSCCETHNFATLLYTLQQWRDLRHIYLYSVTEFINAAVLVYCSYAQVCRLAWFGAIAATCTHTESLSWSC